MNDSLAHDISRKLCTFAPYEYPEGPACSEICSWCQEQTAEIIEIFNRHTEATNDKQPTSIDR